MYTVYTEYSMPEGSYFEFSGGIVTSHHGMVLFVPERDPFTSLDEHWNECEFKFNINNIDFEYFKSNGSDIGVKIGIFLPQEEEEPINILFTEKQLHLIRSMLARPIGYRTVIDINTGECFI